MGSVSAPSSLAEADGLGVGDAVVVLGDVGALAAGLGAATEEDGAAGDGALGDGVDESLDEHPTRATEAIARIAAERRRCTIRPD
ncbi:hypothetical protein [Demequina aurantiaca]|uniref:hypothetical protein n=1 Tax=Demequina aurantiaca TaxID=676200 RepID=UPI001F2129DA|nr:hypothetical protein [Demequina aurantiaca]